MKRYDDILQLADRFLDGRTSLAEERELERFFADHKADIPRMPETLQVLAEMMAGFAIAATPAPAKRPAWRRWRWAASSAAACAAAVLAFAIWHAGPAEPIAESTEPAETVPPTLLIAFYEPETSPATNLLTQDEQVSEQAIASAGLPEVVSEPEPAEPVSEPILLPMATDDGGIKAVIQECELALLEAQFQNYKESITYVKI